MVDFRRWIIVAAVLTLFAGLAGAQVSGPGGSGTQLSCSASVAVPPQLRTEGLTELIGDIVLTCTGGAALPNGSVIPTANITVSLGTNVTSRILTTSNINGGPTQNVSDALLMIDEPGSGLVPTLPGTGPAAPQTPCLNAASTFPLQGAGPGGCVQVVSNAVVPGTGGGVIPTMLSCNTFNAAGACTSTGAPANLYLGLVSVNQVTFAGIPVMPPVTSGSTRVFRMTNIRANVNGLGGGLLNGITPLVASVTISGSTSLPVNNPVLDAGFIQPGLSTSFSAATQSGVANTFLQCNSVSLGNNSVSAENNSFVGVLKYTENFGTAFKTRVAPGPPPPGSPNANGQTGVGTALQNVPGVIYNSESGFVIPVGYFGLTGGFVSQLTQVGLADYGTRLKAVFNNIPAGVHVYVTVTNLASTATGNVTTITGGNVVQPAGNSASSFALLVNGETTPDGNGVVPFLAPTFQTGTGTGVVGLSEVLQSNGSGTAVWEVVNTNPSTNESFVFGVWTSYTANQNANSPAVGTATVNQSYAPTAPAFPAAAGSSASGTLSLPRFADTSTARNVLSIQLCQTLLLYPFVTNQNGFDTGIAIANTTTDPIGTSPQAGICKLTWYDGTGKFPPTGIVGTDLTKEPPVATGTVQTNLASVLAPGFQGYMFAQCNFQLAHGFAFVSDLGARNLAMGYLALVVNNGSLVRANAPAAESLGN